MNQRIKENPLFIGILVCEVILLCTLIVNMFKPMEGHTFRAEDFEDILEWNAIESDEEMVYSRKFALSSGAYTVTVFYDSQSDLLNDTNNVSDIAGYVYLDSYQCPAALHAGTIALNDGKNYKKETIWINYGADIDDLRFSLKYTGNGSLRVEEISIEECFLYRFTRLFGFLLLFVLSNLFYISFFTDWVAVSKGRKKDFAILLGILGISSIPLMGNIVYYGHDLDFHINRIVSLAIALSEGQFPVRIHSDMLNGYGYATPLFYGDAMLYVPAILYLMKIPLGMCYQIYILMNNLLTIAFSYICFKSMTREKKYILLGVFIYTLAPYRLINIYTRAAVGEFTAMTFLPLVVLGFWNIYSKDKWSIRDCCPLIVGLSGIFQSHVISSVMVTMFIGLFCVVEWRKTFQVKRFLCLMKTAMITFFVNVCFLIPMLDSMSMDIKSTSRVGVIQEQGLFPIQWVGLFFSAVGKSLKNTTQEEMGFSLGMPICFGVALAFYVYGKRKDLSSLLFIRMTTVCLGLGVVAVACTSRFFPWDILADRFGTVSKIFCMIQYPWRYLTVATILLSVATIGAFIVTENKIKPITTNFLFVGIIVSTVISVGYYYQQFTYESPAYRILSDNDRNLFYIGNEEYLFSGSNIEPMRTRNIVTPENVEVIEQTKVDGTYVFQCKNGLDMEECVTMPILNYEHYQAVDRQYGMVFDIENGENNCISIALPAHYEGEIEISYQERWVWKICNIISFVTIMLLGIVCFRKREEGSR